VSSIICDRADELTQEGGSTAYIHTRLRTSLPALSLQHTEVEPSPGRKKKERER